MLVDIVITKEGKICDIEIAKSIDPVLDRVAYSIFRNMPYWEPGKFNNVPFSLGLRMYVHFIYDHKPLTENEIAEAKEFEKETKDIQSIDAHCWLHPLPDKNDTIICFCSDYLIQSMIKVETSNADEFKKLRKQRVDYLLKVGESSESSALLFFHSIKKVVNGISAKNGISFWDIPSGENVTIIACKRIDRKVFFAIKETTIRFAVESDLDFKPYTIAQFEEEIEKLNKL